MGRWLNPLDHLMCLPRPLRVALSAWTEHVAFGFPLVDFLRPRTIVELGTHHGVSYFSFCQAVKVLRLGTRCYAVDSWVGDAHSGLYGPKVLADLRAYHDPLYGEYSRLVQSSFDEALKSFPDGSIDLPHIDGLHTYEAVRHDFMTWPAQVAQHAVVVVHDTNVHGRRYGVWGLCGHHPLSLELAHSHGVGVLHLSPGIRSFGLEWRRRDSPEHHPTVAVFANHGVRRLDLSRAQKRDPEPRALQDLVGERGTHRNALTELHRTLASLQGPP